MMIVIISMMVMQVYTVSASVQKSNFTEKCICCKLPNLFISNCKCICLTFQNVSVLHFKILLYWFRFLLQDKQTNKQTDIYVYSQAFVANAKPGLGWRSKSRVLGVFQKSRNCSFNTFKLFVFCLSNWGEPWWGLSAADLSSSTHFGKLAVRQLEGLAHTESTLLRSLDSRAPNEDIKTWLCQIESNCRPMKKVWLTPRCGWMLMYNPLAHQET